MCASTQHPSTWYSVQEYTDFKRVTTPESEISSIVETNLRGLVFEQRSGRKRAVVELGSLISYDKTVWWHHFSNGTREQLKSERPLEYLKNLSTSEINITVTLLCYENSLQDRVTEKLDCVKSRYLCPVINLQYSTRLIFSCVCIFYVWYLQFMRTNETFPCWQARYLRR
jgi:hypothetical protein